MTRCIREIRAGSVNINEVPGYRIELPPFCGMKDSGLSMKEGVLEAIRFIRAVKKAPLPW